MSNILYLYLCEQTINENTVYLRDLYSKGPNHYHNLNAIVQIHVHVHMTGLVKTDSNVFAD